MGFNEITFVLVFRLINECVWRSGALEELLMGLLLSTSLIVLFADDLLIWEHCMHFCIGETTFVLVLHFMNECVCVAFFCIGRTDHVIAALDKWWLSCADDLWSESAVCMQLCVRGFSHLSSYDLWWILGSDCVVTLLPLMRLLRLGQHDGW